MFAAIFRNLKFFRTKNSSELYVALSKTCLHILKWFWLENSMFFYGKVRTILFLVSLKNCCTEVLPSGTAICFWIYLSKRNFRNEEVEALSIIISNRDYQRSFFLNFHVAAYNSVVFWSIWWGYPTNCLWVRITYMPWILMKFWTRILLSNRS